MNYNIKFKEKPFKIEGIIFAPNKSFINAIFEEIDVRSYRILDEDEQKEERTFKVTPCHDSVFHGVDCLEDGDRFGFFKSDADHRPGHAIWLEKKDAERVYNLLLNSIINDKD